MKPRDHHCRECPHNHGEIDRVEIHFADGTTMHLEDDEAEAWAKEHYTVGDRWQVWHGAPRPDEPCGACGKVVVDGWKRVGDTIYHMGCSTFDTELLAKGEGK